jgi:hypothetical protein
VTLASADKNSNARYITATIIFTYLVISGFSGLILEFLNPKPEYMSTKIVEGFVINASEEAPNLTISLIDGREMAFVFPAGFLLAFSREPMSYRPKHKDPIYKNLIATRVFVRYDEIRYLPRAEFFMKAKHRVWEISGVNHSISYAEIQKFFASSTDPLNITRLLFYSFHFFIFSLMAALLRLRVVNSNMEPTMNKDQTRVG